MDKPKILITHPIFKDIVAYLGEHFDVEVNESGILTPEAFKNRAQDKIGLITSPMDEIDSQFLRACPQLRAICHIGPNYPNIDLVACTAHGVVVTNTPAILEESVADLTWALLLDSARRVSESTMWLKENDSWQGWGEPQFLGTDISGATLGIIGMGQIGQAVAKRAAGFNMKILYHSRKRLPTMTEDHYKAKYASLQSVLNQADFVTIHLPYSHKTHHLINHANLSLMQPHAILINTAAANIVDETALTQAIQERKLAGAALDVLDWNAPYYDVLKSCPNVIITPNIASATHKTRHKIAKMAAQSMVITLSISGQPPYWLNPF